MRLFCKRSITLSASLLCAAGTAWADSPYGAPSLLPLPSVGREYQAGQSESVTQRAKYTADPVPAAPADIAPADAAPSTCGPLKAQLRWQVVAATRRWPIAVGATTARAAWSRAAAATGSVLSVAGYESRQAESVLDEL